MAGKCITQALATAAQLRIADHLKEGPRSSEEVALAAEAHAPSVYRLMRALATVGVFDEQEGRLFSLTPIGTLLRTDVPGSLAGMAELFAEPLQWAAWAELTYSVKTGNNAFRKVHGKSVYESVAANPAVAAIFGRAMTGMTTQLTDSIVSAYDFSSFKSIADIGGGYGFLLTSILRANPLLHGILFDVPRVIDAVKPSIAATDLHGRYDAVAGDFFASVPSGCDGLVIKNVVHDWGDDACVTLFKNCAASLAPAGKVLVIEQVLPPAGVPSFSKVSDLEMLVATEGGLERTDAEYGTLFSRAGLKLLRCVPTRGPLQIIEAIHA
jgi:hypothetical protein